MCVFLIIAAESGQALDWGEKKGASTLIIYCCEATEKDNNLLCSSTVNMSNISTHCFVMCKQLSSGWDCARLLMLKLKITKSNYSTISWQKMLCPELLSPRLYLSFSFPSPSLASNISLSLSPCLPPLPVLQQTEWHHHPRWWTAVFENSLNVCVYVCKRRHAWDQHPDHKGPLQWTTTREGSPFSQDIVHDCVCVTILNQISLWVWWGDIRQCEAFYTGE